MTQHLPDDWQQATLLGRAQTADGPSPILVRNGQVYDMARVAPTSAELIALIGESGIPEGGAFLGAVDALDLQLLAPVDLQCVKAAGVTFAASTLERVIEERARGDAVAADAIRAGLVARIGSDLSQVKPGSEQAMALKNALIDDGLWSQYLEVAIGPDAEVFTKCPAMAAVGHGADIGVRSDSSWNNPEPEIALVLDTKGKAIGAMLGNDVNLRDFEGRSALLLGKAKDNNASCALGPFIRIVDDSFTIDDVRTAEVQLHVSGEDGFVMEGSSNMALIARDPLDIAAQTIGRNHQYPDGFIMLLGTMFAPTKDRDTVGQGFTHKPGDIVRISSPKLGVLENRVVHCDQAPAWEFGLTSLMRNLAGRGLLA
jgi:fumarylacetoacetate (FAA) hydrolase family protein